MSRKTIGSKSYQRVRNYSNKKKNMTDGLSSSCMNEIITSCKADPDYVPPWPKMMAVLKQAKAKLHIWIKCSVEYDKKGDTDGFVNMLECARKHASVKYPNNEKDQLQARNMLVTWYTETANVAFKEYDNERALSYYYKAMDCNPNSTYIRVAVARCFLRLGDLEEARNSYLEALRIDGECVCALLGVATIQTQTGNEEDGTEFLEKAYAVDKTNPFVLNKMADHSFALKLYDQCKVFAIQSFNNTDNRFLNSESCYILGKTYHVQGNYENAFGYYYLASITAPQNFILPLYGLGKMFIHRGDKKNAMWCFEIIHKYQPKDISTLKILGFLYAESKNREKLDKGKLYLEKVTKICPEDHESWLKLAELCNVSDPKAALKAYNKGIDLIRQSTDSYILPSVLNNVGALYFKFKKFDKCRINIEESLAVLNEVVIPDVKRRNHLEVTITYNLARVYDELLDDKIALQLYRFIIEDYPDYIDSYLRMGIMAKRSNKISEAYEWFDRALKVDSLHVVTLQLIRKMQSDIDMAMECSSYSVLTEQNENHERNDIFGQYTYTTVYPCAKESVNTMTYLHDFQKNRNQRIELKTKLSTIIDDPKKKVGSVKNPLAREESPERKENKPKRFKSMRFN